ncbi:MAG: helix-turn-helix domain-containing protein [Rhodospirillaceae bacterium]|nr:helix-turn-helix domain-containing protein [Rhodospirillaceae bacterium]
MIMENINPYPTTETSHALADNLRRLCARLGWDQRTLAAKAGISPSTIGNMLNPGRDTASTRLDNIEKCAKALKIQAWQLLLPSLPAEKDALNTALDVFTMFINLPADAQRDIARVAERETTLYKLQKPH